MLSLLFHAVSLVVKVLAVSLIPYAMIVLVLGARFGREWLKKRRYLVVEYLAALYVILLLKVLGFFEGGWNLSESVSVNLVPFTNESPVLMALNLVAFVPLGFFLPALFQPFRRTWATVLCGFAVSVAVEFVQALFMGRLGDVDDVVFNTLGCCVGYVLFVLARKLYRRSDGMETGAGTSSFVMASAALVLSIPYKWLPLGFVAVAMLAPGAQSRFSAVLAVVAVAVLMSVVAIVLAVHNKDGFLAKPAICVAIVAIALAVACAFFSGGGLSW